MLLWPLHFNYYTILYSDHFVRQVLSNIVRQPPPPQYAPPMQQIQPMPQQPSQIQIQQQQQQPPQPPQMPQQNQYDEDMGYRTMTREDVAILQERRISSNVMSPQPTSPMTPQQNNVPAPPTMPVGAPSPVSPPQGVPGSRDGHQRTVSAPPAPPPPPGPPVGLVTAPPPPPPPPMNMSRSHSSDGGEVNSLAAQLQNARLKRNNKVEFEKD